MSSSTFSISVEVPHLFSGDQVWHQQRKEKNTIHYSKSWSLGSNLNRWTDEEFPMQLAGHLRGQTLQEWDLLKADDQKSFSAATQALQTRLDPGNRALAAQDFRHLSQSEAEPVSNFIRRLERTFQVTHG